MPGAIASAVAGALSLPRWANPGRSPGLAVAIWLALTVSTLAQGFPVHRAPGDQTAPALAYGAGPGTPGAYLIVYQHGWPQEIRGILIDQAGKELANVDVAVGGTQHRASPDVAYNSKDNQFLVVWQEEKSPDDHDIVGQMIDGQGTPQAGPIPIAATSRMERAARVAYNSDDNEFLVVWEDDLMLPLKAAAEIRGRRITGAGEKQGGSFKITDYDTEKAHGLSAPAVSYGKGQYLVAWERQTEVRIENFVGAHYDVSARHISNLGKPKWPGFCVSCVPGTAQRPTDEMQPSITHNPQTGMWVVVFSMRGQPRVDEHIARVLVNYHTVAYPQLPGPPTCAHCGSQVINMYNWREPRHRQNPRVVYSGSGDRFLACWKEDVMATGDEPEIWCSSLDPFSASPQRRSDDLGMDWTYYQHYVGAPALAAGDDNILIVWEDDRDRSAQGIELYGWRSPR